MTNIQLLKEGPILILADEIRVIDNDGNIETISGTVALCRCGQSENKPFCDGRHKSFEGMLPERLIYAENQHESNGTMSPIKGE